MNCDILNKLIPVHEFLANPEYAKYLASECGIAYMETEFVVRTPQFVVPQQKRIYRCDLYVLDSQDPKLYNYVELCEATTWKGETFRGTCHYFHIVLEEVWEDDGDDGHVWNKLQGYRFLAEGEPL